MHIAFLTPEYPNVSSTSSGGLGTSIHNLATSLAGNGAEVSIVIYGETKDHAFTKAGIHYYLVKKKRYWFGGWYLYRKYLQHYLNQLAEDKKIDILETADWTGITAFMNLQVPCVVRLHGSDAYFCELEGRKQKWKNRWFEKRALKGADRILAVSAFTGHKTRDIFRLDKSFTVIPNGVNVNDFKASRHGEHPNTLLYFGTLIRKKGFLELAGIFNKVVVKNPEIKLLIAGRDVIDIKEMKSTWEVFYSALSDQAIEKVEYKGEVSYEKVKNLLQASTVVIFPSFAEAFPMTWLEAMAMEKALVTSNIGWANEIMTNGITGYTVNPVDHDSFANRILSLFKHPDSRRKMASQARKRVMEQFSSELIAQRNLAFYTDVINSRNVD